MGMVSRSYRGRRFLAFSSRLLTLMAAVIVAGGCASFPAVAPEFSAAPTVEPRGAIVIPPEIPAGDGPSAPSDEQQATGDDPQPAPGAPLESEDPCAPPELPIIAVCLDSPTGLAVLPDGESALVAEQYSGKLLRIAPGLDPLLVTNILDAADTADSSSSTSVFDIALSPYFIEDNLVYALVGGEGSAAIMRISMDGDTKIIVSDLSLATDTGAAVGFGDDGLLYVAIGAHHSAASTTDNDTERGEDSPDLTGAVLRFDSFGQPAPLRLHDSNVYAHGLTHPTAICAFDDGQIAIVDHRPTADVLVGIAPDADLSDTAATVWTYDIGDGGAWGCAATSDILATTYRSTPGILTLTRSDNGGFVGSPEQLLGDEYGHLRTIVAGPGELLWVTTDNRSKVSTGDTAADPSDDKVIVIPAGGGAGGGGGLD